MLAQLKQVAITYVTRPTPLEWLVIVGMPLMWLGILHAQAESNFMPFLAGLALGVSVNNRASDQLHWQCAHGRAALLPGFKMPHLAAAWATTLIVTAMVPLLFCQSEHHSVWAVIASATIGAALTWNSKAASSIYWPVFIAVIFGRDYFDEAAIANWANAVGYRLYVLIAGTLLAWIALVVRDLAVVRQREDDRTYKAPVAGETSERLSRTFRIAKERAASIESARQLERSWWTSTRINRGIAAAPRMSTWRRLNFVYAEPTSLSSTWGNIAICVIIGGTFFVQEFRRQDAWAAEQLPHLSYWAAFLSAFCVAMPATPLVKRLPQMTAERLFPLSNQAYANAILLVYLWRCTKLWLLLQAAVAFVVFALPWQRLEPVAIADFASYLAIAIAGLACGCGVCALFSLFYGLGPLLFAATIVAASTLGLQIYWTNLDPHESQTAALVWAGIFTAIGIGSAAIARIEWRNKEFAATLSDRFT
jgi:hypothetical protein